ncbi:MAG: DNA polymerase III subunit beta [Proteobacteria bacterium]|nr:DNA polymerase III subunit beta [Pseudomonadota bacterium]MBU1687614.1 DNA polymerase III subunit beta [Pseudomonadota bacterium]
MALSVNLSRDEFLAALSSIQNITGKKGTIAILSNVLIEGEKDKDKITLTATDLELGIRINIAADIIAGGSITLPAKKLFEIIRETSADSIHMELHDNNWIKIDANSSSYNVAGMSAEEFPEFPVFDNNNMVEVPTSSLKDLIDKTIFSVSQEGESQFNLSCLLFEKDKNDSEINQLRMVSSDGHRLSLMQVEVDSNIDLLKFNKKTLIPKKGIQEIRKFIDHHYLVNFGFDNNQIIIKTNNSILIIRLMNGDFPDYRNIISIINQEKFIEIKRVDLIQSMKRMILFTEDRFNAVKFILSNNSLLLTSESIDIGNAKDEINISYSDKSLSLGFNGKYFIESLQVMHSELIKIYINSEESPCLIKGDEDHGFYSVIMPMKI